MGAMDRRHGLRARPGLHSIEHFSPADCSAQDIFGGRHSPVAAALRLAYRNRWLDTPTRPASDRPEADEP